MGDFYIIFIALLANCGFCLYGLSCHLICGQAFRIEYIFRLEMRGETEMPAKCQIAHNVQTLKNNNIQ